MFFNQLKTALLLATLSSFLLLVGNLLGGTTGLQIALAMAVIINCITYFFSEKIVLSLYKAQTLDKIEYGWIYEIVKELANTMNMPMPKLWIIKTPMANAFATGRNPDHASVAVTTGILEILERNELRGVLAHELSHIKNRDILISTVAATLATAIGYLASILQHAAFWGLVQNKQKRTSNPIAMIVVAIIMPIAAMLIQLAISRSREYLADETGAECCRDPLALASALEKLQNHIPHAHMDNNDAAHASTAPLFIVHPFSGNSMSNLFSTHPPMEERVGRLRQLNSKLF
jgi:heat shock protein HtpX